MKKGVLVRIYLEKKYILVFRILMIVISACSLWRIAYVLQQGHVFRNGGEVYSNQPSFYTYLLKFLIMFLLFLWFGTGGVKEKNEET
ncbi:hypothetical protein [Neptunicella sp. SCSIO 80796]|uniref:hypothetical protein n=1 Tax=Neptunicella plasticusilytica TaxID=3117012 RepID=UPI003A4D3A5D